MKCDKCNASMKKINQKFVSNQKQKNGKKIVIKDTYYLKCQNEECNYTLVPGEEVFRIEQLIKSAKL